MQESLGAGAGVAGGICRLEQPRGSDPVGLPLPATLGNPELCPVTHAPAQVFGIWISKGRRMPFISAPVDLPSPGAGS